MPAAWPELVDEVCRRLTGGGVTVLSMPGGGRTTVLNAVATTLRATGTPVCQVTCAPSGSGTPHLGLAGLLEQMRGGFAGLPDPQMAALEVVLRQRHGVVDTAALCMATRRLTAEPRSLIVIDDVQWLDEASQQVLDYAVRSHGAGAMLLVSRRGDLPGTQLDRGSAEIALSPLSLAQVGELLQARGMSHRLAGRIHAGSGGNPSLALALAVSNAEHTAELPLPGSVTRLCRELLATVTASVQRTLLLVALSEEPTLALIRRAGEGDLAEDINAAVAAGLVSVAEGEVVHLRSGAVATTLIADANPDTKRAAHRLLADAALDEPEQIWHEAILATRPDDQLVDRITAAAGAAAGGGARRRAALLRMRAAELTTVARADEAMNLLAQAAVDAAAAGHQDLVHRALSRLESRRPPGAVVARARLAAVDAAGQAMDNAAEMLGRVLIEAADQPDLLSAAHVRLAWRANLVEGSPSNATRHAQLAVTHARSGSDPTTVAAALTMLARMQRLTGDSTAGETLAEALMLAPQQETDLHNSPAFLAIRHAVFDDRLAEARAALLQLLPRAEVTGMTEDLVDLLRSLAEIDLRQGRCEAATGHALRAVAIAEHAGISPGPGWCSAAAATLAGGSITEARHYAESAAQVSAEEHDQVYLSRSLHVRGLIELLTRDAVAACTTLTQVRQLEERQQVGDPSQLRWHADLAEALVAAGRLDEAKALLSNVRAVVQSRQLPGVHATLDRAEGLLLAECGEGSEAVRILHRSVETFAGLGMPLEQGRSLIAMAVAERRRRRRAAARAAALASMELLTGIGAKNWAQAAANAIGQTSSATSSLTASDQRVVKLLQRGASNREISATLFLSVKTVEATLTRIYRTFGVKSRTQLCSVLSEEGSQPRP